MVTYRALEVISPVWIVAAHKAASRGTTASAGLPVPDGMLGRFSVRFFLLADGSVRWALVFYDRSTGIQTQVAKWIGDTLPECSGGANRKLADTHGKPVLIDADDRQGNVHVKTARVMIDNAGLPVPVPEAVLRRNTAQQIADWLRGLGVMVDALRVEQVQRMVTA